MTYPPEFIARVKAAYQDYSDLYRLLDTGGVMVGPYLCDGIPTIKESDISALLKKKDFAGMQRMIDRHKEKKKLWEDWQQTDIAKANGYGQTT